MSIDGSERDDKYAQLQEIGASAARALAEMVAALDCDYDRLEELKDERESMEFDRERLVELDTTENNESIDNLIESDDATELVELREADCALREWDALNSEELAELRGAAGECSNREEAEERIQEDPLSIELSGTWTIGDTPTADRAVITLTTGGPAVRIVCELDANMEPHRAWIEAQDWFQPWTEYQGGAISMGELLTYCRCFYFGEGVEE